MSTQDPGGPDAGLTLHAPVEGDGYYKAKALQWVDLCPHMGAAEARLLRLLTNLTTEESQTRRIAPAELRRMVYSGPVEVGQAPKTVSASGLLRLLRSLAELGQITAPDGSRLRFSSREPAQLRGVSMAIWRYPRHECGCARNAFDALSVTRGDGPRFGPVSSDPAAAWPAQPADQAGQKDNPRDQIVNPPDQISDPRGQIVNPDSQGDQPKHDPPLTPSSSFSSSSSVTGVTPDTCAPEEEEKKNEKESPDGDSRGAAGPPADSGAPAVLDRALEQWHSTHRHPDTRERRALVKRITAELAAGAAAADVVHHLTRDLAPARVATTAVQIAMSRTREPGWGQRPRPGARGPQNRADGPMVKCTTHFEALPCPTCARLRGTGRPPALLAAMLREYGPERRPDLAELLAG